MCIKPVKTFKKWVENHTQQPILKCHALQAEASQRQYYRLYCADKTYILMVTPVESIPITPFVEIADRLAKVGICVPNILAIEAKQGLILLSDLGQMHYQEALQSNDTRRLYTDAIDTLLTMQHTSFEQLPIYDTDFLLRELAICEEWYFAKHLKIQFSAKEQQTWQQFQTQLLTRVLKQTTVFVHRDYHCRNIMWTNNQPGILDFQDAVRGPITYDLVSLLRDAYITWPHEMVLTLANYYWQQAKIQCLPVQTDFATFYHDFEWMGLQRHLKILGIFARLYHRDGKDRYLNDMACVLRYVYQVTQRYPELKALHTLLKHIHQEG